MELIVVSERHDVKSVVDLMNQHFKNQEQFELRLDVICLDIAGKLDMFYVRDGDTLRFQDRNLQYVTIV